MVFKHRSTPGCSSGLSSNRTVRPEEGGAKALPSFFLLQYRLVSSARGDLVRSLFAQFCHSFFASAFLSHVFSAKLVAPPAIRFLTLRFHVQVRLANNPPAPKGFWLSWSPRISSPIDQSFTDSSGRCRFVPPAPTVYYVERKVAGYSDATSERLDFRTHKQVWQIWSCTADSGATPSNSKEGHHLCCDLAVPEGHAKNLKRGKNL